MRFLPRRSYNLGTLVSTDDGAGAQAVYVHAQSILAQYNFVVIDENNKAHNATTTNVGTISHENRSCSAICPGK